MRPRRLLLRLLTASLNGLLNYRISLLTHKSPEQISYRGWSRTPESFFFFFKSSVVTKGNSTTHTYR